MPPAACNRCKKRGKIWTENSAPKPAAGGTLPVPVVPKAPQAPAAVPVNPRGAVPTATPHPPTTTVPTMLAPPTTTQIPTTSNSAASSQPTVAPIPQLPPFVQAPLEDSLPKAAPLQRKPRPQRLLWELELSETNERLPQRACPAIDQSGRIYLNVGRSLRAYDLDEGKLNLAWEFSTGGRVLSSPVVGPDGVVRIHSDGGKLYSVNRGASW